MIYILLTIGYLLPADFSIGQRKEIDSLNNVLTSLKDSAVIDCLNELSNQYILAEKKDSATYYANLALEEAKRLNYIHGMASALTRKSIIAKHFDDDFITSEHAGKEALYCYEKTLNKTGIDTLYTYLMYAAFSQSKFDEAIYYNEKFYAIVKQQKDELKMIQALRISSTIYRQKGDYEKSFLLVQQAYSYAVRTKNKIELSNTLYCIAQLYALIEDYQNALNFFQQVLQIDDKETLNDRIKTDNDIWFRMEFAEVFSHLNQFDSAWYYYNLFKPANGNYKHLCAYWVSTGECYFLQKDFIHALQNFQLGLAEHRKLNDGNEIMRTLLDIGKTYLALNDNKKALTYGSEGLSIAEQVKSRQFIRDGCQILYSVYDRLHQTDSAYFYFRKYILMKDVVLNDQTKGKLVAYSYDQKIELLNKAKLISDQRIKIQQQQIEQVSLQKEILIAGIIGILLLAIFIFRYTMLKRRNERQQLEHEIAIQKLESEKKQTALQKQATELEMQALRAQMSPHFIFNCLSSINRFILKNEMEAASDYLTKFSRLIRMVLNNSKQTFITLEDELEMLRLYLDLERLRFKNSFDYSFVFTNSIDVDNVFIPPLLLQPFAENAIWHGLMHKQGSGHLEISLAAQDKILTCTIADNGVGRSNAAILKSKSTEKQKSMGLQITKERLALLNQGKEVETSFDIEDIEDESGNAAGTKVILKMHYKNMTEAFA